MSEGHRSTPVVAGVYFLFKEDEMVYVGQSKDCYGRIEAHRTNGRKFDLATVMPLDMQFVGKVEKALIKAYRPPENTVHKKQSAAAQAGPDRRLMLPLPGRYVERVAPGPDGLGLISQQQCRKLAVSYGLPSNTIDIAVQDGAVKMKPVLRSGRQVQVGMYDDIAAFLEAKRRERLETLGFVSGETVAPASSDRGVR